MDTTETLLSQEDLLDIQSDLARNLGPQVESAAAFIRRKAMFCVALKALERSAAEIRDNLLVEFCAKDGDADQVRSLNPRTINAYLRQAKKEIESAPGGKQKLAAYIEAMKQQGYGPKAFRSATVPAPVAALSPRVEAPLPRPAAAPVREPIVAKPVALVAPQAQPGEMASPAVVSPSPLNDTTSPRQGASASVAVIAPPEGKPALDSKGVAYAYPCDAAVLRPQIKDFEWADVRRRIEAHQSANDMVELHPGCSRRVRASVIKGVQGGWIKTHEDFIKNNYDDTSSAVR